jgi:hypothetical protein
MGSGRWAADVTAAQAAMSKLRRAGSKPRFKNYLKSQLKSITLPLMFTMSAAIESGMESAAEDVPRSSMWGILYAMTTGQLGHITKATPTSKVTQTPTLSIVRTLVPV